MFITLWNKNNPKNLDNKISDKSLKNNNFHKLKIKNSKNKKTDQNISTKNRSVKFKLRKFIVLMW